MKLNIKNEIFYFRKRIARDVTSFGTWSFVALMFFILLILYQRSFATLYLIAVLSAGLLELCIKCFHKKNRPDIKKVHLISLYQEFEEHSSFPSGHSAKAAVLPALLHMQYGNIYLTAFFAVVALLVAWSRVELERHYVRDVVVGLALGVLVASLVFSFAS